ncbi:MAG: polysaccharide biosynthesis protein [Hominenteromicrobium sp.]
MDKLKLDLKWLSRVALVALLDAACVFFSFFSALALRFELRLNSIDPEFLNGFWHSIIFWCAITIIIFAAFDLYNSIWSYVSENELFRLLWAHAVLIPIGALCVKLSGLHMPRSYYVVGLVFSFMSTTAIRFAYRFARQIRVKARGKLHGDVRQNIMVIGAGDAGRVLIREYASSKYLNGRVVCIIDDNPAKQGRKLEGIPVVGNRHAIPEMVRQYRVNKIVFAIPSASAETRKDILSICSTAKCEVQAIPGVYQLVNGDVSVSKLKKVEIQDLLGREPIQVNLDEIYRYISGKVVMVTGGGGSIGSELCRQIAKSNPKQLVILDIYENNAYGIQRELEHSYPELDLVVLIGSVRNTARLDYILGKYRPEMVFHAAAHKHVPLMENSPNEAIKNNVFGTYKMAQAAVKYGVKKFVLISTDKAVNPTNIMGASKRLCEMVIQMMNRESDTEFVAVRFGNVLGSNGSVVPIFEKQIAAGGPVTVTHPDITRFFMTIPEAVSLVLQAGYYAKGGEIFVLDMGQPVKIDDMARNLIRLSGYEPDVDIKIEYTGLRPGEKLYEELLMEEEGLKETENKLIHIGKPIEMDDESFKEQLKVLEAAYKAEAENMKELVAEIVPTYKPQEV